MFILEKQAKQIIHLENPFNAVPDLTELGQHEITPNENFFHRNHGNIPLVVCAFDEGGNFQPEDKGGLELQRLLQ